MKYVTTNTIGARVESALILAAAALTLGITTTYAQSSVKMTAEIPFSFNVGKVEYPAGKYIASVVSTSGGVRLLTVANVSTGMTRFAVSAGPLYAANGVSDNDPARLVFRCGGDAGCALAQVWPGNSATGMLMKTPSAKGNEKQHLAVIALRPANAD